METGIAFIELALMGLMGYDGLRYTLTESGTAQVRSLLALHHGRSTRLSSRTTLNTRSHA